MPGVGEFDTKNLYVLIIHVPSDKFHVKYPQNNDITNNLISPLILLLSNHNIQQSLFTSVVTSP